MGKTRLAVEAAHRLAAESTDPVWLVELAGVSDPAGVGAAVARAIGVADVSGGGGSARSMSAVDAVVAQLLGTAALVVLDNCEHVVAEVAGVVDELLGSLPELRIIATSREILGVPGETLTHARRPGDPRPPPSCSPTEPPPSNERFVLDEGTRRARSRRSAPGSTACPSPSSSPPPACARCRWPSWRRVSMTASGC